MTPTIPSIWLLETWLELLHNRELPLQPCFVSNKIIDIFGSITAAELYLEKEKLKQLACDTVTAKTKLHI